MFKEIKTNIIPSKQYFVKVKDEAVLDKKAICAFVTTGFFLDNDTYWKNVKTLRPGTINKVDEHGYLIASKKWFEWNYQPRDITFGKVVEEFTDLFDSINAEDLQGKNVILPVSGGLDSRSQVVSLLDSNNQINSFSYSFKGGFKESKIAKKVAKIAGFPFQEFEITPGYLWDKIDFAAQTNKCYAEFTHCTQLNVIEKFETMGDKFSLGHWGDVLFDKVTDKNLQTPEELLQHLKAKLVKPMGMDLAKDLWDSWNLDGDFESYFDARVTNLLQDIKTTNINTKLRAFKSMYWAPRWTSVNLAFYSCKHPISLPYYNDKICQFICTVPEEFLADRKIQIAYIKNKAPIIARVTWQDKRPFNLYNFHLSKMPYNLPYKIANKLKREFNALIGKKYIQRNWELQFLGTENTKRLKSYLANSNINQIISEDLVQNYTNKFYQGNQKHTSHSLSMLLTIAAFSKYYLNNPEAHIKND